MKGVEFFSQSGVYDFQIDQSIGGLVKVTGKLVSD